MKKILTALIVCATGMHIQGTEEVQKPTFEEITGAFYSTPNNVLELIKKADPAVLQEKDTEGDTLLHYAASYKNTPIAVFEYIINTQKTLDEKKRSINQRDSNGELPIGLAVINEAIQEIVELLIENTSINDILTKNPKNGKTPLHHAVEKNNESLTSLLLETLSADAIDNKGNLPIDYANSNEIFFILKDKTNTKLLSVKNLIKAIQNKKDSGLINSWVQFIQKLYPDNNLLIMALQATTDSNVINTIAQYLTKKDAEAGIEYIVKDTSDFQEYPEAIQILVNLQKKYGLSTSAQEIIKNKPYADKILLLSAFGIAEPSDFMPTFTNTINCIHLELVQHTGTVL